MNGAGYFSPCYFGAAFISTRPAPGPHQARTKGFMNEAVPSSGLNSLHGQRSHNSRSANTEHFRSVYGVFSLIPWQLSLMWPSSWMGHRKSSAALLIVFERNFYCLARTILVRTKNAWVTEKGISWSQALYISLCFYPDIARNLI